jgi:hypothetical protein
MNLQDRNVDRRGIVLTDNVNLEFLKSLTPRYNSEFCKFVVNTALNKVAVGMDIHAQTDINNGDEENIFGGNIFFEDGHIVYESTLNIYHNMRSQFFKKNRRENPNPRIITDPDLILIINNCLLSWVKL